METSICWSRYGDLLRETISWFKKRGIKYREKPWNLEFLYKYSRGTALDLGSGIASTTRHLLSRGVIEKLVLVDLVDESLKIVCRNNYLIQCIVGDILEPIFTSECFDTIYLLAVLHHIPGSECRELLLKNVYGILKKNGYLIISVWNPDMDSLNISYNVEKLSDRDYMLHDKHGSRYYHFYEINELLDLFKKTGYKIVELGTFIQNPEKPLLTRNLYFVVKRSE
ncbi:MAG: methyltransferase type 12 [Desulfurococcales archaeon ex4484_58]|nr:MAG: methyltransferase type 12 [Desulfurococcales archaeon ex4484_58]